MSRLAPIAAALALTAVSASASARVHWLCGLSDDLTRLVCVADVDIAAEPLPVTAPATATVRGTPFPLDPRREWIVPLWAPADDSDFVELLARSTICYRTPACMVTVVTPLDRPARGAAAAR